MATTFQIGARRVVPRWRSFKEALLTHEVDPAAAPSPKRISGEEFLRVKEREWRGNRELAFATDLVSAAHVLGTSDAAKEAAEFVLAAQSDASRLARQLAASLLGRTEDDSPFSLSRDLREETHDKIAQLKRRRRDEPRNAFVWTDLARLYVLLGLVDQAQKPIRIALGLAPFDRFVLRSASRFYLHAGMPDEALAVLQKSARTRVDPWLIAAELAVAPAAGKTPRFTKEAEDLIRRKLIPPIHASEMTAALASLEMWSGNNRRAKRLFNQTLVRPTENALAQTVWAARKVGLPEIPPDVLSIRNAFEAQALAAGNDAQWNRAFDRANQWIKDESFSVRPYAFSSALVTSILGDASRGETIARNGLTTNPGHPSLVNNIAFALVEQGRPEEANEQLKQADMAKANDPARICLLATQGLVKYRLGDRIQGKLLYRQAIELAEQTDNGALKAIAQLYLAREEAFAGEPDYASLLKLATRECLRANSPQTTALASIVQEQVHGFESRMGPVVDRPSGSGAKGSPLHH